MNLHNPVLPGFSPDPSVVRVGSDYYIATSTFEWFPGVCLHHSRDLVHWRLAGHALTRRSQIDLAGVPDSGGVWAPSLSHADGKFWLVYTIVRTCGRGRPFKDLRIYLTTAPAIEGPWSDPVTLNALGFDPSLFHDDNGDKWLVNMIWDFRPGHNRFGGIVVQRYDAAACQLTGSFTKILAQEELTEGPNLYRHNGWYYLMLVQGGTGWQHAITMARSRSVTGPYELDPQQCVLTSRDAPDLPLQKAGHGELVATPAGDWYLAHLASRPLPQPGPRRCLLGRETCLQRVRWSADGWLRLASGGWHPEVEVPAPAGVAPSPWPEQPARDDFESTGLDPQWQSLRCPAEPSWLSLALKPGWLSLRGRQSLHSLFEQSLVAQRLRAFNAVARTCVDFAPSHYTQMAGLVCYYDTQTHFYLRITDDERLGRVVGIVLTDDGAYQELVETQMPIALWPCCHLQAELRNGGLQFSVSPDGNAWQTVGPCLDGSKLSDDYGQPLHFTGAMVGVCAQDLGGTGIWAHFDYFSLE